MSGMNCLPCAVALLPADKLYATIQRNDTAVCVEIDSPADMNDAVIEMDDEPILQRKLPHTEVFAEGVEEKYIAPWHVHILQDCIDHMRRKHRIPLSVKAANMAKYFPAWTLSRVEWSKMLMPCVSGVAIDTLLFSLVGSPLCHRYRLISHTGSHPAFRGTYLRCL